MNVYLNFTHAKPLSQHGRFKVELYISNIRRPKVTPDKEWLVNQPSTATPHWIFSTGNVCLGIMNKLNEIERTLKVSGTDICYIQEAEIPQIVP